MRRYDELSFTAEEAARLRRLIEGGKPQPKTVCIYTGGKVIDVPVTDFAPGEAPPVLHGRLRDGDVRYGRRRVQGNEAI